MEKGNEATSGSENGSPHPHNTRTPNNVLPAAVLKDSCRKVCRSSSKPWRSRIPAALSSFCLPFWLAHPFQPIRGAIPTIQTDKIAVRPFSEFDVRCCHPRPLSHFVSFVSFCSTSIPHSLGEGGSALISHFSGLIRDKNIYDSSLYASVQKPRSSQKFAFHSCQFVSNRSLQKQKITKRTHFTLVDSVITIITYVRPVRNRKEKRTHLLPPNLNFRRPIPF
jgi:hypothetical protein